MNKVAIWDYFGVSKAHYLTLAESEKRDNITKYYLDMKSRNNTCKRYIFLLLLFSFFFWKWNTKWLSVWYWEIISLMWIKRLTGGFFCIAYIVSIAVRAQSILDFRKNWKEIILRLKTHILSGGKFILLMCYLFWNRLDERF